MGKTNVLIYWPGLNVFQKSSKDPCGVCFKGVGTNSVFKCKTVHWTGQTNRWQTNVIGQSGSGEAWGGAIRMLLWGLLIHKWRLWTRHYHKMPCRLGQIRPAPACPHLRSLPITSRGRVYNSCVGSAMLHASETGAPTSSDLHRLHCNDRVMIRWMYGVTTKDQVSSQGLLQRMQLDDLAKVLRTHRPRWQGHVEWSDGLLKKVRKLKSNRRSWAWPP